MGTKRSYSDVEADAGIRRGHANKKHKKAARPQADPDSLGKVKKRARAIERKLRHDSASMPPLVHDDLQRELAALRQRIEEHGVKKKRSAMISKYHMVRFFERKKAQRLEKRLRRTLEQATDPEEMEKLKADLHVARVDINYAIYFPFMERYASLYPASSAKAEETDGKPSAELALRSERPPMWRVVEEAMKEGPSALLELQNRRPASVSGARPDAFSSRRRTPKSKGPPGKESSEEKKGDSAPEGGRERRAPAGDKHPNKGRPKETTTGRVDDESSAPDGFFDVSKS